MRTSAAQLAARGWEVFPLAGKVPAIAGGRGMLDATTDPAMIAAWWTRFPWANIGARVPSHFVVLDVDPRHGGDRGLAELEARHGQLPSTLTVWSGRGDGGRHLYWWRPAGELHMSRLPRGIDVKTHAGYVVMPPSIHPDSGRPYRWHLAPVAAMPWWLVALLTEPPAKAPVCPVSRPVRLAGGRSVADDFNAGASWHDVLDGHGWRCVKGDGDRDGSVWLHPAATSACSATVRDGRLYVYSPNTPFAVTQPGRPRGYSRFDALATLTHNGDRRAAAREIRRTGALP